MLSAVSTAQPMERVAFNRLLWVGPLTILVAVIANVLIQQIAGVVLQPDPGFIPLTLMPPIMFTIIGVLGAVIVFALFGRFARRPIRLFQQIALGVLLVSLIPDVALLIANALPGTTIGAVGALMLMHLAAGLITVRMLTTLARS